jgi:hypothetical protein
MIEAEAGSQRAADRPRLDQQRAALREGADRYRASAQAPQLVAHHAGQRADKRCALRLRNARQRRIQQRPRNARSAQDRIDVHTFPPRAQQQPVNLRYRNRVVGHRRGHAVTIRFAAADHYAGSSLQFKKL